ncbi:MAG: SMC-Scp complex subunit ScpB [Candidatus Wolfebacteria bacterium]|nr:SMC-Scp complex subunit ScpB [Candidatus Wolfebacteria bacterium]
MDELEKSNNQNLAAAIEAILFVYGEPVETGKLAKSLSQNGGFGKVGKEEVKLALKKLEEELSSGSRGLKLIFSGEPEEKVQLATNPDFSGLLEEFSKDEVKENLSPASIETLSLISYLGPLSRAKLDYYRGVNSSFILRSLLIRGLVNRSPDPKRGNAFLYQASFDLLKYLGLSRVEDLPEYSKFKDSDTRESIGLN